VQSAFALRPSVTNAPAAIHLNKEYPPQIEFTAVEFGYERQKDMLHIPSLRILPGEHVAIAGENGAGKSTLAKLIARFYDPVRGTICLGGKDIRNIQLESLRRHICYLPRDPVLFDGTLLSNLRFAQPAASAWDLRDAIQSAGLSSFAAALPDGLRQRIGPGGCQLSGGERQRLAIARALLQRPRLLILDEATSCLDSSAEAYVLENIRRDLASSTLIVVSHRLTTFSTFRRVLILSGGRIVTDGPLDLRMIAQGTHSRLVISTASCLEQTLGDLSS
jgi:ABC-type multidrug transport system fused ATPase/permease subunit